MTNSATPAYRGDMDVVRTAVSDLVEDIFGALTRIGEATTGLWDRLDGNVRAANLADLRDVIVTELTGRATPLHGAGLVLAPDALADRSRHLEWWRSADGAHRAGGAGGAGGTGGAGGAPQRARFDLNPDSDYCYDYSAMEWFVIPRDRGTRWVTGPYLDYTGVDLYICTFAVPVRSTAGAFLGIAGTDVTLASLDATLMPALRAGRRPVALANDEGRVIVGNHPDYVTGSRLKRSDIARGEQVPGTQWTLVDLSDEQVVHNV